MSFLSRSTFTTAPRNLCELFLRDITSLLITSRTAASSLSTLRPKCTFSEELQEKLDTIIAVSQAGDVHLTEPLREGGIILPTAAAAGASAFVVNFFTRLPIGATPGVLASEVVASLRMLAQHLELRARLAAEKALVVGQEELGRALFNWADEWRTCSRNLRATTVRALMQAYIADIPGSSTWATALRPESEGGSGAPFPPHHAQSFAT